MLIDKYIAQSEDDDDDAAGRELPQTPRQGHKIYKLPAFISS